LLKQPNVCQHITICGLGLQLPSLVVLGRMWGRIIQVWQCRIRNGKLVEGVMPWQRTTTMLQNGKRHHKCQFYVGKLWVRQGNSKGCKGNDGNVKDGDNGGNVNEMMVDGEMARDFLAHHSLVTPMFR